MNLSIGRVYYSLFVTKNQKNFKRLGNEGTFF